MVDSGQLVGILKLSGAAKRANSEFKTCSATHLFGHNFLTYYPLSSLLQPSSSVSLSYMITIKFQQLSAFLLLASRSATTMAFSPTSRHCRSAMLGCARTHYLVTRGFHTARTSGRRQLPPNYNFQRYMSSDESEGEIRHIGRQEMQQILTEHEEMVQAELESPYFVLDVRTQGEVDATGKLSPSVPTLPVQVMGPPYNALQMDDDDFEESFGFAKPPKTKIMVFSCAAGVRSVTACKLAQQAGYQECTNYMGGANEWFAPS